jgi:CDP-diacylglycerol--glycerol-3-phosphate 3-phosphatidyltransferase
MAGGADAGEGGTRGPRAFQRRLPNALTIGRVVMTVAFVAVLSLYRFPDANAWTLPVALVLFVVAAATDALDGYLARRWRVVSVFGRIVDPLADKVLILGAFILLAGPGFSTTDAYGGAAASGVAPWMVVLLLARELLVTTMRAVLEGRGIDFSAAWSGKIKMIVQSIAVPLILLLLLVAARYAAPAEASGEGRSLIATTCFKWNEAIAWGVTLVTAWSAWPYIRRGAAGLKGDSEGQPRG